MPECCADIVIDYGNYDTSFCDFSFGVFVFCSTLSGVNCGRFGILALFYVLIADSFGIVALLQVLMLTILVF